MICDFVPVVLYFLLFVWNSEMRRLISVNCWLQAEKITTLLKAANVHAESYWPALFAKLAEKQNILDLISNVGAGGGGGGGGAPAVAAPAAGGAAAAAPVAEEKKVNCEFL